MESLSLKFRQKSKGEIKRYTHLNAEFRRIARRDKKAFLSDQCKEIDEKNRMWKTRDLFKKIWHTKGTFHAKMGSIKDLILTDRPFFQVKWSEVAQSCPTLCDLMDCSLPGSSIYGILQAIVLEWVAISFSRGSSRPKDQTPVSCIVDRRFAVWATGKYLQAFSTILSRSFERKEVRDWEKLKGSGEVE